MRPQFLVPLAALAVVSVLAPVNALTVPTLQQSRRGSTSSLVPLASSNNNNNNDDDTNNREFLAQLTFGGYTVKQRLREEVESPFRKVRLLFFGSSVGSALTALYFSFLSTIKAVTNEGNPGRFPDAPSLDEALTSDAINVGAAVICAVLCYREYQAGQVNLRRIAQGGRLASLVVDSLDGKQQRKTLKDYRRASRVVIAVGGKEYLERLAESLKTSSMGIKLAQNDLVLVPVLLVPSSNASPSPAVSASDLRVAGDSGDVWKQCLDQAGVDINDGDTDDLDAAPLANVLAVPRGPAMWTEYLTKFDLDTAMSTQNIDVLNKGVYIVVKKNGKILKRATGLPPWQEMIGFMEVADGSQFGMPGDTEKYGA